MADLFAGPLHPYTQGLLLSMPGERVPRGQDLHVIPGVVPDLESLAHGCRFRERCARAIGRCESDDPQLELLGSGRGVACHNPVPREAGA